MNDNVTTNDTNNLPTWDTTDLTSGESSSFDAELGAFGLNDRPEGELVAFNPLGLLGGKEVNAQTTSFFDGLVPSANATGLFYEAGDLPPNPEELDAGVYGLTGVEDNGGAFRRFFTHPTLQRGEEIIPIAKEGDTVEVGDPLYRVVNVGAENDLVAAKDNLEDAKDALPSIITEEKRRLTGDAGRLDREISSLGVQINGLDSRVAGLDRRIQNQKQNIESANQRVIDNQKLVDRIDSTTVLEEGGLSLDGYVDRTDDLNTAIEDLKVAENELVVLETERETILGEQEGLENARDSLTKERLLIDTIETLTPEQAIALVKDNNAANLPASVVTAANRIISAENSVAGAEKALAGYTVKSVASGEFSQQLPEGFVLNTLDGTAALNNSTAGSLGEVPDDPERIRDGSINDGSTPSVIPDPDTQAIISIQGVNQTQAEKFAVGETVKFRTSDGRTGLAQVYFNKHDSDNGGFKIKLENPRFLDGTPLKTEEKRPIQVYSDSTPDITRTDGSTETVTLEPPTKFIEAPNELPEVEQTFNVRVPIYAKPETGGDEVLLGHMNVTGTTRSNTRETNVIEQKAWITAADSNVSVPVNVDVAVSEVSNGSNSAGGVRKDSGVKLQVSVPFIGQNGTISTDRTDGNSYTIDLKSKESNPDSANEDEGGLIPDWLEGLADRIPSISGGRTGSGSDSFTVTELPKSQQLNLPIYIAPSGDVNGNESIVVQTPAALQTNVANGDLPDPKDLR
ncbi:hypothetical protein [uncultured Tateyamaria sp.]|uniref:hypothetical protein n=1 Tax=uncultured Tateyamaria sp. TaxID=455651 RepID=UPI0026371027|nr:hypothetical protein [uncultured Tateyamaria sp.]